MKWSTWDKEKEQWVMLLWNFLPERVAERYLGETARKTKWIEREEDLTIL